jgi:hypothetical protein
LVRQTHDHLSRATTYSVQIAQLKALGIEVVLRGFWVATMPPGLLHHELRGTRLSRWRLPDLLADVDRLLASDGTGIS